MYPFL
jgi:5-methyltetrahydrofolate--homocysteine methyltransferase